MLVPETSSPRFRRSPDWTRSSESALLVILILVFLAKGLIPAWRHLNSDFPNYYLVARLYRQGYPVERVYDWVWLQRQKDHQAIDVPLVSYIPSTLPSALMVLPWSSLSPLQAKHWWLLVNLAFLLVTAVLLSAVTKMHPRRIALLMFLAVIPLRDSFLYGQMHILVLLLITFAAFLYFEDSFFFSGVVLAIAATLKIYPALFLIFFAFKKHWRAAIGLIVGLSSATMISVYLFGINTCRLYVQEILPRALMGETIDPYNVGWNSLTALLRRLFIAEPELNPAPVAHAPALYAFLHPLVHGFIFVTFMWAIGSKTGGVGRRKLEWATFLFLLLLLSSQPGPYHFVVLILAAVLVIDYLVAHQQSIKAGSFVVIYALICGPLVRLPGVSAAGWSNLMFFSRLALMVLLGGVLLWILIPLTPESPGKRFNSRVSLPAASVLVGLVAIGYISNMRHLQGQFDNYQSRVVTVPGSAIATDPIVTSDGLFFTALVPRSIPSIRDTYKVYEFRAASIASFAVGGDWFHPAVRKDGHPAWVEVSTNSGSRVVRFSPAFSENPVDETMVEAEDAEQPIVSLDGELLSFIRPVKGRGSLWVRDIGAGRPGTVTIGERQITGSQYDVRESAFFPDHRMVFSARREGRFRLYEADLASGVITEMNVPTCSARYPAGSPDGEWIAFSCDQRGAWQIHVMNRHTREQVQLTNADCNSVSPAWTLDSKELIYATDCSRGIGLTALARLSAFR